MLTNPSSLPTEQSATVVSLLVGLLGKSKPIGMLLAICKMQLKDQIHIFCSKLVLQFKSEEVRTYVLYI